MSFDRRRMFEALERAKRINLEAVIGELQDREPRHASANQMEGRRQFLLNRYDDPLVANRQLERILKGNELSDINYLLRGFLTARAVCRIAIHRGTRFVGYGTGFLVAPGVVMTNQHVLETEEEVASSEAHFGYERDLNGIEPQQYSKYRLLLDPKPIIFPDLDVTLAAVSPSADNGDRLDRWGWLKLNPHPGKAFIGEYLTIIQHPGGEPKQVCVRENKLLKYDQNGPYLWYQTDTTGGSSGAPVFNNDWQVVALHHSAVPRTKKIKGQQVWVMQNGEPWTSDMGDDRVDWIANEGIRISKILAFLREEHGRAAIARAVLDAAVPALPERSDGAWDSSVSTSVGRDGLMRVRVPIEVAVRLAIGSQAETPRARQEPQQNDAAILRPRAIEKVVINQDNYDERSGYDPGFLGGGVSLPLPKLVKNAKQALLIDGKQEIKYWTYSVLFNKRRRLAFVSAANVDPSRWRGNRDAEGDTWYDDKRIAEIDPELQLGKGFYKKQKTFEADRSANPFDQGHLTRRSDVQWGDNEATAKRNGDDSYHYTNCAPQHWAFNQNNRKSGIWFRLETHAAAASAGERLCMFNGPIFDAPVSVPGDDGRLLLNLKGKRQSDGTFGDVLIPRLFFKVFAYRQGKKLRSAAFIVSQEDMLDSVDRYLPPEEKKKAPPLSDLELRLYQVPVAAVERMTGLKFGDLADSAPIQEALKIAGEVYLEDSRDIVW